MTAKISIRDLVEFTLTREEGDIQVFAANKEDAVRVISQHGIHVDMKKIKQTGTKLTDHLKACYCPSCGKPK